MDTKRIFVLGNGFDLAHYLPTAYVHFMDAMRVIESCKEDQELGFDDLFQNYLSDESSDRDKKFFSKTKELYRTDNLKLSARRVECLQDKLKNNGWFQHFKHHLTDVDTWIDFENEIETVLLTIDVLVSTDFEHDTVTRENIKINTEYPLERYQIGKNSFDDFLGDNLVQFSPKYMNEMKFKSVQIQRVLRDFSITSKIFGSCKEVSDYGMVKKVNSFSLHDSHDEREKFRLHKNPNSSLFMNFDIDKVVDKMYLNRLSSFYISFNKREVFKKILTDLECFTEIFRLYIRLIINKLEPIKPFNVFDDLRK